MSHLITSFLDTAIHNLIMQPHQYNIKYSRYFGDITFSINKDQYLKKSFNLDNNELTDDMKGLIDKYKFKINANKVHFIIHKLQQQVTGLIVNKNEVNIDRRYIRNISSYIHQLLLSSGGLLVGNLSIFSNY